MSSSLRDRLVLITGASAGIGRASVAAFADAGARVIGVARSEEGLSVTRGLIGDDDDFVPIVADVADARSMDIMARRTLEIGLPDVLVANAGVGLDALFVETTDDDLRAVFEVNVFGVYRTVRPFLPAMIERGSGRVVIVSSIVGKRGVPHYSGYSASKFALHGVADALRSELWRSGVTVGLICPTSTETGFRARATHRGPAQNTSRPRRHTAESVAAAVVRMAASRRREMVLSVEGKLMSAASTLAPRVMDWILARALTRKGQG